MDEGEHDVTFMSPKHRTAKASLFIVVICVLALLLKSMSVQPTMLTEGYMGVVGLAIVWFVIGAVRSFRLGITLDDRGVVARMAYSTRSWRWEEIDRASTIDREPRVTTSLVNVRGVVRTPDDPRLHVTPVVWPTGKPPAILKGLRLTTTNGSLNWVDDAVGAINSRLATRRGATPS